MRCQIHTNLRCFILPFCYYIVLFLASTRYEFLENFIDHWEVRQTKDFELSNFTVTINSPIFSQEFLGCRGCQLVACKPHPATFLLSRKGASGRELPYTGKSCWSATSQGGLQRSS